ncbi:site-specific integrase [Ciceribacter sp. L1K22]|uniref:tyrosine-type recombinase/integrase n=1 Tax=Ciceribacter sp. L1K22 TaxID=2820275 RepID=UPI001ABDA893|nr:site-specific integrase [Ciceribacter sp. L1K22]MBO3760038.1 tyrosine-type recombinase/integrase [Ciceribacter sp. L1K22]
MGAHTRNVLTVKGISSSKAAKLRDGGGLWLVTKGKARYWILSYTFGGRRREMGIGPLHSVTLADARERAAKAREMVRCGVDPIHEKRQALAEQPKAKTFGEYADSFIDAAVAAGRWRGGKTEARWRNMIQKHAAPIRDRPIAEVDLEDVKRVLKPLWGTKQESAEKLRECIERVLDAAKVEKLRMGDNPAAWRGNLEHVMHKPNAVGKNHHPAMPYSNVPAFMKKLSGVSGVSARALEFAILTCSRSGEARGAVWTEVDFKSKVWTIPAVRMKGGKQHRVPLSPPAIALLKEMKEQSVNEYVFPGVRDKRPLSDASLAKALRSAGGTAVTVHGFRSTFRDWATEAAHAPREIAEAALAHAVGDVVERSYARSDALDRRRTLMDTWAQHCIG